MSNKVVPQIYRSIIDKVISSVRPDFEENGIEEAVLVALQQSWEAKLAMSRVTDFSSDPRLGAYQRMLPPTEEPAKDQPPSQGHENGNGTGADVKPVIDATPSGPSTSTSQQSLPPSSSNPAPPQNESNEINSDLDDDDEDVLDDDDDEDAGPGGEGDMIIALYEKVQRVKNKWKITLKDGVISADGKDYLFSKCQGDFEW